MVIVGPPMPAPSGRVRPVTGQGLRLAVMSGCRPGGWPLHPRHRETCPTVVPSASLPLVILPGAVTTGPLFPLALSLALAIRR